MAKYMKIQKKSLLQRLLKMPRNTRLKPYTTRMAKIQDPNEGKTYSNCRNVPFCGQAKAWLTGALSKGVKMRGVATNVYLWKTSKKLKETSRNENSKFGSCIYVRGRY